MLLLTKQHPPILVGYSLVGRVVGTRKECVLCLFIPFRRRMDSSAPLCTRDPNDGYSAEKEGVFFCLVW